MTQDTNDESDDEFESGVITLGNGGDGPDDSPPGAGAVAVVKHSRSEETPRPKGVGSEPALAVA